MKREKERCQEWGTSEERKGGEERCQEPLFDRLTVPDTNGTAACVDVGYAER
jgi:hypothetical protein